MNLVVMTKDHIAEAQALTTSFNWPHTVEDWSFAFGLGFGHVACQDNKLLGTCLTWRFGPSVSSLGLLVVAREAQGQGIGRALLRRALEAETGRTTVLHATHQGEDLYRSEQFVPTGEIRQYQGVVKRQRNASTRTDLPKAHLLHTASSSSALAQILALDRQATGLDRQALLTGLLPRVRVCILGPPDALEGYAFSRRFGRGHVIGPVIAPTPAGAMGLVSGLLDVHAGEFTRLDITEDFEHTEELSACGLSEFDRVLAMAKGPPPESSGETRRFALISHAFG